MFAAWRRCRYTNKVHNKYFSHSAFKASLLYLVMVAHAALGTSAFAQTSPAPPAASARVDVQMQVAFPKIDQRRPVKIEIYNGAILFEAKIGGRSVWGLFDNGSTETLIDTGFAQSIGLDVSPRIANVPTLGGKVAIRSIGSVEVEIPGQFSFNKSVNLSADLTQLEPRYKRPISLLIGKELFDQFLFVFVVSEQTFQMGESGTFRPPPRGIELQLVNDPPELDVVINGRSARLKVDLGDGKVISLSEAAWTRLGLDRRGATKDTAMALDGTKTVSWTTIADKVSVGPVKFDRLPVSQSYVTPGQGDGRIGMGFFSGFNFIIDQKAHKIWLYPLAFTSNAPPQRDQGRQADPKN